MQMLIQKATRIDPTQPMQRKKPPETPTRFMCNQANQRTHESSRQGDRSWAAGRQTECILPRTQPMQESQQDRDGPHALQINRPTLGAGRPAQFQPVAARYVGLNGFASSDFLRMSCLFPPHLSGLNLRCKRTHINGTPCSSPALAGHQCPSTTTQAMRLHAKLTC